MKSVKFILLAMFTLTIMQSIAQTSTQQLFTSSSPRVRFNESQLLALYTKDVNTTVSLSSAQDNFQIQGTVISNDLNSATNTRFVVIKLTNFQDGTFFKLKSFTENGVAQYKATITNSAYNDAYQISARFDGLFVMSKFNANQVEALVP
ncbi:hypothetical protein LBMAG25_06730 [Bacteroidota bacterium]|nr:hypothetical protein LBMAG25_06730 [Bacteroidota bacterium]